MASRAGLGLFSLREKELTRRVKATGQRVIKHRHIVEEALSLDRPESEAGKGLDFLPVLLCRMTGRREPERMDWRQYAVSFLAFNAALFVVTFALLYAQQFLPVNPDGKGALGAN